MNPLHLCHRSESRPDECNLSVLARKRIDRYGDEQNCQSVPSGWVAAEWKICSGFIIPCRHPVSKNPSPISLRNESQAGKCHL